MKTKIHVEANSGTFGKILRLKEGKRIVLEVLNNGVRYKKVLVCTKEVEL